MNHTGPIPVNIDGQIILFRIVQEALNNVIKHANATNVIITLSSTPSNFVVSIKDDGKGFDTASRKDGVGLMNIKHRASLLNGQLQLVSAPGKGAEINIILPPAKGVNKLQVG